MKTSALRAGDSQLWRLAGGVPVISRHLIGRFRPGCILKQHQPIQRPPTRSIFYGGMNETI